MPTIRQISPGEPAVWHAEFLQVLEAAEIQADGYDSPNVLADEVVLLAVDEDRVVGVAVGHPTTSPLDDGFGRFGRFAALPVPQGWLDLIAVAPAARQRGAGRLLVRAFAEVMSSRGCSHVALRVDQSTPQEARVAFFTTCGLSPIDDADDDLLGAEITTLLDVTTS